jgi:hypothetical protein
MNNFTKTLILLDVLCFGYKFFVHLRLNKIEKRMGNFQFYIILPFLIFLPIIRKFKNDSLKSLKKQGNISLSLAYLIFIIIILTS